jgi:hypothetical protein
MEREGFPTDCVLYAAERMSDRSDGSDGIFFLPFSREGKSAA